MVDVDFGMIEAWEKRALQEKLPETTPLLYHKWLAGLPKKEKYTP